MGGLSSLAGLRPYDGRSSLQPRGIALVGGRQRHPVLDSQNSARLRTASWTWRLITVNCQPRSSACAHANSRSTSRSRGWWARPTSGPRSRRRWWWMAVAQQMAATLALAVWHGRFGPFSGPALSCSPLGDEAGVRQRRCNGSARGHHAKRRKGSVWNEGKPRGQPTTPIGRGCREQEECQRDRSNRLNC